QPSAHIAELMGGATGHIEDRARHSMVIRLVGAKDKLAFPDEKDLIETLMDMQPRARAGQDHRLEAAQRSSRMTALELDRDTSAQIGNGVAFARTCDQADLSRCVRSQTACRLLGAEIQAIGCSQRDEVVRLKPWLPLPPSRFFEPSGKVGRG